MTINLIIKTHMKDNTNEGITNQYNDEPTFINHKVLIGAFIILRIISFEEVTGADSTFFAYPECCNHNDLN